MTNKVLLLLLFLTLLMESFPFSRGCCGNTTFTPLYTTWASQYKGILYTAEFCNVDEVQWMLNYPEDEYWGSRGYDQTMHFRDYKGGWSRYEFNYNEFSSSLKASESCIATTLEVTIPLNKSFNGINLQLTCQHACIVQDFIINVKCCNETLHDGVIVTSFSKYEFNSSGDFSCPKDEKLFYSESIKLTDTDTVCLKSAQWLGQDGLQCWKAPTNVTLQHNSTSCNVVGDTLSLSCLYDSTFPQGNMSSFVIDGEVHNVTKGETFLIHTQKQHDGSKIFCQAQTPFTQVYTGTGKSDFITISVFSQPGNVKANVNTSDDIIKSGTTIFLNSAQTVPLKCTSDVDFASCVWKFNETVFSTSCDANQHFNQSGFVTCQVSNCVGSQESRRKQITVLESRLPIIKYDSNGLHQIFSGTDLTLNCSVLYQNELNTSFVWEIPANDRNLDFSISILTLSNLTRLDWGNYTCITYNGFGTEQSTVFVDVLFAPVSEHKKTVNCSHDEVENGLCVFQFSSNPLVDAWALSANETVIDCPSCHITILNGSTLQTLHFILTTALDKKYELTLESSLFPNESLIAYIHVTSIDLKQPGTSDQTIVIATSVIGSIVFVGMAIAVVFFYRRNSIQKKSAETTKQDVIYIDTSGEGKQKDATNNKEFVITENHYEELDNHVYENYVDQGTSNYEIVSLPFKEEQTYASDI